MKASRILLVSNVRPSRTWNFANRIVREVPGTEVCGIVQSPMRSIPWVQQMIAKTRTREISSAPRAWSEARSFFYFLLDKLAEWFYWFVHGCPASLDSSRFTLKILKQGCVRAGWPLKVSSRGNWADVVDLCPKRPDLLIVLGEFASLPAIPVNASMGCIRAGTRKSEANGKSTGDVSIRVEHLAPGASTPFLIFSQLLPWQPFDGDLGFALKADLITDDLLLQAAQSLLANNPEVASTEVSQWANEILLPSLSQLKGTNKDTHTTERGAERCRAIWRLCLDSVLLLSPQVLGRNWYRRLRRRYPVLILAHHLVSDRHHRMGMPTEIFWRQVLFLKKHYRIVTLEEASELLRSGRVRVPTVALTFDDGYGDNFLGLRAVGNETRTPSTLFLTTGPVETHSEFEHDLIKGMTGFLPLTWGQIAYWKTRGAEFGSHTRTHFDCGSTNFEKLQYEIVGSRQDLEAHLKNSVAIFAFPYGKQKNISRAAMDVAASAYRHYLSSFGGECLAKRDKLEGHLFRKKFYGSPWELELELQSVFDLVDALKQRFSRTSAVPALSPSIQTISSPGSPTAAYSHVKDS